MSQESPKKIVSIIVSYEPDIEGLMHTISALRGQVFTVVIVDNKSTNNIVNHIKSIKDSFIHLIELSENYGIAYAQNVGLEWALNNSATNALLMDQDSIPSADMVENLLKGFDDKKDVAAVGPSYIDVRNNARSFFVINRNGLPRRWKPKENSADEAYLDVAFLISSGTIIDLSVIKKIGGKRSGYFIDHVDTEWSLRSISSGFRLLGIPKATMMHSLGDQVRFVWFFGKRQVSYHSPLRDYYMFRNTLLMLRDVSMRWSWKVLFVWRLVQFAGYFLVFSPDRKERLKKMILGLRHGALNIRGKLDIKTLKCTSIPKTSLDLW